jgi:hypothetical protein
MNTSTQNLIVLRELEGNPPVQLDPLQQFLAPHVEVLIAFWVAVWCGTAIFLLVKLAREYREYRKTSRR